MRSLPIPSEMADAAWGLVEAHTIAAAYALRSMDDVIAQVINVIILNGCLGENRVSINKVRDEVRDELKKRNYRSPQPRGTSVVLDAMNDLFNSSEFRYIGAFVNTIKHRRLLDSIIYGESRRGSASIQEVRFVEFQYGNDCYPSLSASEIHTICAGYISYEICVIGNALN